MPNLNLLPAELLPVPLPWLTAGLALLGLGLVMLLYALFYMRSYTDLEIGAFKSRFAAAQATARQLGIPVDEDQSLPPGTLDDWTELRAREINWPALFGAITSSASKVNLSGVTQTGYTLSIAGDAATSADANDFLQKLRDSGLFASLEMSIAGDEGQPTMVATAVAPSPQPTPPPGPTLASPGIIVQPTIPPPPPTPPGGFPTRAPPTPQPTQPPQPTATLAPRTPLATPTPLGTPPTVAPTQPPPGSPTVAATNTPAFDFVVQSKRETVDPNATGYTSSVRVRVIDANGNLVPGLRAHIDSQGDPPWSAELPKNTDQPSDGTFVFPVGMGKFTVYLLNGYSERATDLFTGVQGQKGVHVWDVTFRKTVSGTPASSPTCPNCTPVPTATNTFTPIPAPTPISFGPNIAGFACITASANGGNAYRVADGDLGSVWDSGAAPVQQVTLDFTHYASADRNRACQPVTGTDPTSYLIEAVELVTNMSGPSKQTIELWALFDDSTSALVNTFQDVDLVDGQTLSYKFPVPRQVKTLVVRTVRSNVNVGWREIRLYSPLPPAIGTWTPTPTATPVVTGVPTSQVPTPSAPQVFGTTVSASSEVVGNEAAKAADQNESTFWRPAPGDGAPELDVVLDSPQQVNYVRFVNSIGDGGTTTSTPTAGPTTPTTTAFGATYQISVVQDSGTAAAAAPKTAQGRTSQATIETSCGPSHLLTADDQTVQENCGTTTNVQRIKIKILSSQGGAMPGLREVSVYGSNTTPTQTATITPTGTATPPAATVTAQAAATLTVLTCQNVSPTCTPTATPTNSPTAGPGTATPTATQTATQTPTVPPGLDAAQGAGGASSADSDAGHPAPLAVDTTGSPPKQDPSTYWQANTFAVGTTTKTWSLSSLGGINVTAVQARLFMPSSASSSITFRLVDNTTSTIHVDQAISGTYTDNQIVGVSFATPVPNVGQVSIIFSQVAVAPGLRTVGVYEPVSSRSVRSGLRAMLDRLPQSLASILEPGTAQAASELQQAYPPPNGPPQSTSPFATPTPFIPLPAQQSGTYPPPNGATGPFAAPTQPPQSQPPPPQPASAQTPPPAQPFPPQPARPAGVPAASSIATATPTSTITPTPTAVITANGQAAPNLPRPAQIPITGNPFPGSAAAPTAAPPSSGGLPQPAPPTRGRVSFLIVAQVRPGS